ncbi:MAG: hypothetical protein ACLRX4_08255 [Oscillospiraceae bacterium]
MVKEETFRDEGKTISLQKNTIPKGNGNITAAESTSVEHLRTLQNHGHDYRLSFLKFLIEYHARIALSRQKNGFSAISFLKTRYKRIL